jgi:hypothetical protein
MKKLTPQERRNQASGGRGGRGKAKRDGKVSETLQAILLNLTKKGKS